MKQMTRYKGVDYCSPECAEKARKVDSNRQQLNPYTLRKTDELDRIKRQAANYRDTERR